MLICQLEQFSQSSCGTIHSQISLIDRNNMLPANFQISTLKISRILLETEPSPLTVLNNLFPPENFFSQTFLFFTIYKPNFIDLTPFPLCKEHPGKSDCQKIELRLDVGIDSHRKTQPLTATVND